MPKRQPYALSYAPPLKHQLTISGAVRLNVGWTGSRADRINSIEEGSTIAFCAIVRGVVPKLTGAASEPPRLASFHSGSAPLLTQEGSLLVSILCNPQ